MKREILTICLLVAIITMITPIQLSTYASPTTEDDGYTYPDDATEDEKEEIDEEEQQKFEDAGSPGNNNDDGVQGVDRNNDDDDDDDKLPRCEYKVVRDCILNDLGQTCKVGTDEDACQDVFYGYNGAKYKPGDKIVDPSINEPNPYCDTDRGKAASVCHDRLDYDQETGLYPCNDGTQKTDWRDCKDATEKHDSDNGSSVPTIENTQLKTLNGNPVNETRWYKNCGGGGRQDGGFLQFNTFTYDHCGTNASGDKAYYDGFVEGCMEIDDPKYTKEICESFVIECLRAQGSEIVTYESDCTASSLGQTWNKILDDQKPTVIQSASAGTNDTATATADTGEDSSCRLDGSADGIQQKFDTAKYLACKLHTNNDKIYYDGFVAGCMNVGNTKLICQTVADSSILNMR